MTDLIDVTTSLSSRTWRGALQRHVRDHVADLVVTPVRDGVDCLERSPGVIVLDDDTSWVSVPFLTRAREAGAVVIGIFDPAETDGHGHSYLQRLGVDHIASAATSCDDLVELIRAVRPVRADHHAFAELSATVSDRIADEHRRVIAIGGPAGAGVTEITIGLAQVWSLGTPLVVDVDETHPSLARRLGLGIHPHLITAIETLRGERSNAATAVAHHDHAASSLDDCLARPAIDGPSLPFDVIAGLASRDDWSLVRADELGELIDELAARWSVVFARLGPQLEDLSRYVDRYDLSRSAARRAERLIGVCDASATGVLRFVDWLVDSLTLIGDTPIDVILNRTPRSPAIRSQVEDQLRTIAGDRIGEIVAVPLDRRVERAAWDATTIGRGGFTKALTPYARALGEARVSEVAA